MSPLDVIHARIQQVRRLGLYRELHPHDECDGVRVRQGDRWLINFSSNDYLGLAQHPDLKSAAVAAIERWGTGSGASRLVTGSTALHEALEAEIAAWKSTDTAVAFNSGYQANLGVLSALTKRGDRIFYDQRVHASLKDGIKVSQATSHEFLHNDLAHLRTLLEQHSSSRLRLIVTESVFSMDGDLAPLAEIWELTQAFDCLLLVDEAHGIGVFGPEGGGVCSQMGLNSSTLIQVGTCGKALGSFGAYVACSLPVAELLRNRSRSFIYTTALPPPAIAATQAAIRHVRKCPAARKQLYRNRQYFESRSGVSTLSQIIPIVLGSSHTAMAVSQDLKEQGLWVQAIRPPTVPQGTARLRVSLSAAHSYKQIDRLCHALTPWLNRSA